MKVSFRMRVLFFMVLGVLGIPMHSAHAATCQIPLRKVLVEAADCSYYVTAFRMLSTHKVAVDATCKRGQFKGPKGVGYSAELATTATVQNTTCASMKAIELNPVLLSEARCSSLESVFRMLATPYVDIRPSCRYGKTWTGADGNPRTSMIATRMRMRPKNRLAKN